MAVAEPTAAKGQVTLPESAPDLHPAAHRGYLGPGHDEPGPHRVWPNPLTVA